MGKEHPESALTSPVPSLSMGKGQVGTKKDETGQSALPFSTALCRGIRIRGSGKCPQVPDPVTIMVG